MVLAAPDRAALLTLQNLAVLLYFLLPANIMLYGVNDYFDRDIDEDNPKKQGKEARYRDSVVTNTFVLASLLAAVPLSIFLDSTGWALAAFVLLSVSYSAPPFRFKARPFLDSVSNGLYIIPFVVAYTEVSGSFPPLALILGGWFWSMAMHTFSAIPDIEPDRKNGVSTTATFLGRDYTYVYCGSFWMLASISVSIYSTLGGLLLSLYVPLLAGFYLSGMSDSEAYWYYPYINAGVGAFCTLASLWVIKGVPF